MTCLEKRTDDQSTETDMMTSTLTSKLSDLKNIKMVKTVLSIPTQIEKYTSCFILNEAQIIEVMKRFEYSLDNGLTKESNVVMKSSLKMIPTFLHDVPNSSQKGSYVALDLGGTNLRFFKIDLKGDSFSFSSRHHSIPLYCMEGSKDDLFGFLANALKEGLEANHMETERIPFIGFTFSFPVQQTSLCSGNLICWTKGFKTEGVEGEDVSKLMKEAAKKLGLNVGDFVLINDTTGTLLSGALLDSHCAIGVINGTGTNACYIEDLNRVSKWNNTESPSTASQILINTEWGALGSSGELKSIITDYDILLDAQSMRPGHHMFEKMISGMYLGELARLVMVDMAKNGVIFGGQVPEIFSTPNSLDTRYLSNAYNLPELVTIFKQDFGIELSKTDTECLSSLFDIICFRSAQLISCAISVLIRRINRNNCTVAVDGSLFLKNPFYLTYVNKMIKRIVKGRRFTIIHADDGSGKGAALAAAVASRAYSNHKPDSLIEY